MFLATTTVEDYECFERIFSTTGAEKRRQHGSKGAQVFRDPNEEPGSGRRSMGTRRAGRASSPTPTSRRSCNGWGTAEWAADGRGRRQLRRVARRVTRNVHVTRSSFGRDRRNLTHAPTPTLAWPIRLERSPTRRPAVVHGRRARGLVLGDRGDQRRRRLGQQIVVLQGRRDAASRRSCAAKSSKRTRSMSYSVAFSPGQGCCRGGGRDALHLPGAIRGGHGAGAGAGTR